jgi:predicted small lipoprotein YifL
MARHLFRIVLMGALAACGGDGPVDPPPPPADARIVVTSGTVQWVTAKTDRIELSLQNTGGPGFFKVEFWGLRTSPTGSHRLFATTEAVEVQASYRENVVYNIPVSSAPDTDWVIVYSRNPGTAVYRQTDCHRFNGNSTCPEP